MTQKELLYVEDAISHEDVIISNIEEYINCLDDENLVYFMKKDKKNHENMKKELLKLLEDESNE